MIRAEHVREELNEAKKVMDDTKSTADDKIQVLYKLITVAIKVALSVRTNTTIMMKKIGAETVTPKSKVENKE